jgi:hypothetical protein
MVRVKAWNGSAWADTKIWDGSAWRSYVPPVYGAQAYVENMSGIPAGWVGDGYSGYTIQNWGNIHVYVDGRSTEYSSLDMELLREEYTENVGILGGPIYIQPGTTVKVQASVLIQLIEGGATGENCDLFLDCSMKSTQASNTYGQANPKLNIQVGSGGWGWGVLTTDTDNLVIPANAKEPADFVLSRLKVGYYPRSTTGVYSLYRLFIDWIQLVDQNNNVLMKMTTPAVEPIKVWNGTAWV